MSHLDGRYNWHDDAEPEAAAFLARASSVASREDGETAVAYVGLYDADGRPVGDVGVAVSELPEGLGTVYRVQVADGRIVDLESGPSVVDAWREARADAD